MDEIHLASVGLSSLYSLSETPCLEFMRRKRSTPRHTAAGPQTRTRNRVQLSFVIFPTCSFAPRGSRSSRPITRCKHLFRPPREVRAWFHDLLAVLLLYPTLEMTTLRRRSSYVTTLLHSAPGMPVLRTPSNRLHLL